MALSSSNSSLETDMKIKNSGFPEREIGTQGLRKQILRKGNSWQTPFPGDEVEGKLMKTLLQKAFQSLFVTS
jgi:FK506-binding protein 4/5